MKIKIQVLIILMAILSCICPQFIFAKEIEIKDEIPTEYLVGKDLVKRTYKPKFIQDEAEFVLKDKGLKRIRMNNPNFSDGKITMTSEDKLFKKPVYNNTVNLSKGIPVHISPLEKTKSQMIYHYERSFDKFYIVEDVYPNVGAPVNFVVTQDVIKNGTVFIKKGTKVHGIIGYTHAPMYEGLAHEINVERLKTKDINGNVINLYGIVSVQGKDLSVLSDFSGGVVGLIGYVLNFTNANLKTQDIYVVYYR